MNSDFYPLSIKGHRTKRLRKIHKPDSVEKEDISARLPLTRLNYYTSHTNAKEKLLARESEEGRVPLLPSGAC
jgi:hypothetical protein